jgi:5,6-dimethylbenzimidazole synthase
LSRIENDRRLAAIYDVIHRRRDVRSEFSGGPASPAVLRRILAAGHAAPSVGLSQPWDFILVEDPATRQTFRDHVLQERARFADSLEDERSERFAGIRIEGVLSSSVGVVVTYDQERAAPAVLGRHTIPETGLYSVCLAIQNIWLAATAEGWGLGWVSFYREGVLADLLGLPQAIRPVAWLCLGPVTRLAETPDLERAGWRARRPLSEAVHDGRWGAGPPAGFDGDDDGPGGLDRSGG